MKLSKSQVSKICHKLNVDLIDFQFLARGNHNEVFKLETKQRDFILRIENNFQFKNLKKEYSFLKQLNCKLTPKVYLFDKSKKILSNDYFVQEFIVGVHPERKVSADFVRSMALWYKSLHSFKSNKSPFLKKGYYSLFERFKPYKKKFEKLKNNLSEEIRKECEAFIQNCEHIFEKNDRLFSRRKNLSLNHGDPTRTNVFYKKGEVKLIDWEFVQYDLKERELVFFKYSYDLTTSQWDLFLKTYGYLNSKQSKKQLNIILILHYLGMIAWRIERLDLLSKGKADLRQSSSNRNKMLTELKEELNEAKKLLV